MEYVGRYPIKLLLNILSDGMDFAARGFWAQINRYQWYWWYVRYENGEPNTDLINPELTPDTVLIEMRDNEDGEAEEENRPFTGITLQKLADATDWALETHSHLLSYWVENGKITDIDYDAVGADVIIQKIVLGEVVYG